MLFRRDEIHIKVQRKRISKKKNQENEAGKIIAPAPAALRESKAGC